jgi:cell division septation protein DedD
MATNPDQDEFLEDDEQDELSRRSIFSAGWFRALLVLTVLAIVVVVSLPYLLNWLEPTVSPPARTQAKSSESAPAPAPPATSTQAPTLIPAPATSGKAEAPAPAPSEAPKPIPAPVPAPAPPSPADRPLGTAPLPVVPAPPAPGGKPAPAAKSATTAQTAPAVKPEPATRPAPAPKRSPALEGGSPGGYWIQVGAFLEARNAESLAKQLRGESFPVQVSEVSRGGAPSRAKPSGEQNQLFITGSTPDAVNAALALKGKGTAQAVKGGVVVVPPFDLETAMSLSSSLKKEGFKVVIRRAKPTSAKATSGGVTYHVVRVGGFADRPKAQQARGELEAKGHPGFLTQGAAR